MAGVPEVCGRFYARRKARRPAPAVQQSTVRPMNAARERRRRIRSLNDEFRTGGPPSGGKGRWLLTRGVLALGEEHVGIALSLMRDFSSFDEANDPHGEHDFGVIQVAGERLYWKIDYYNNSLDGGSEDPADEATTHRVLTLMLASEY